LSAIKKFSNRNTILKFLFRNTPVSRIEIAGGTGITPATVTSVTKELINEKLVIETGEPVAYATSGRKPILIDLLYDNILNIGVEFTEKGVRSCLCNAKGEIIKKKFDPFNEATAENINHIIVSHISELISDKNEDKIKGIGIALPGHANRENGKLVSNRKIWDNFDPDFIKKQFFLPICFENNVRCMAIAEYFFHSGHTPNNFSFFHIGLGMFCANVINGELFLGSSYVSGEIGHTIVSSNGAKCECGKYGCLQTFSSERWLIKYAGLLYKNSSSLILRSLADNERDITIKQITDAYSMGDPLIRNYIADALKYLGNSISNIAILMNPDKIFLHSKMFDNPDIKEEIMSLIRDQLLFIESIYVNNIEILPFSDMDGAVGAAALSLLENFIYI